ncbi:hypothetical protein IVB18_23485 [Bradyrhizobium sp. 186]|uniref:hypothetical protein n=1 Tax=Bradyrhizobium sp. 186 TaxID=2782654 RepID=UPI0020011C80|nr:hypothetical protein [Bradyrhizobium sp. 186]UPK39927.1 hypothetical protein IVB18_23485 [Bradyrhizobium sp. 186]
MSQEQLPQKERSDRGLGRLMHAIGGMLFQLLLFAMRRRSRYFIRLSVNCHMACLLEVWSKISEGPLDSASRSYKDADAAIAYYLMRSSTSRASFTSFEQKILGWHLVAWYRAQTDVPDARKHFNFVRKHRLAKIIRYYENLQNYIAYVATSEIAALQQLVKEPVSRDEWKSKVSFDRLPPELKDKPHRARRLASLLAKKLQSLRREIAIKNYFKIDFALSDITSFIAISGALLLLLGFGRVAFFGWYFDIPFARYFSTTDYIASGLGEIYGYLIAAVLAAMLAFYRVATATAVSLQAPDFYQRSWSGRAERWTLHFTGVSAIAALVVVAVQSHWVDTISLAVALSYVISMLLWSVSLRFFKDPLKAGVLLTVVLVSAATTFVGTINEIQRITHSSSSARHRTIQFSEVVFDEPTWKILAITNNFVILRRQSDGVVVVKARTDLKFIEDQSPLPDATRS